MLLDPLYLLLLVFYESGRAHEDALRWIYVHRSLFDRRNLLVSFGVLRKHRIFLLVASSCSCRVELHFVFLGG